MELILCLYGKWNLIPLFNPFMAVLLADCSRVAPRFHARLFALLLAACLIFDSALEMSFISPAVALRQSVPSAAAFSMQALSARVTAQQNTALGTHQPAPSALLEMSRTLLQWGIQAATGAQPPKPEIAQELTKHQWNILHRAGLNLPYSPQKAGAGSAKVSASHLASRFGLSDPTRPQRWGSIYYRLMAYAHEHQPPIVEIDSVRLNLLLDLLDSLSARLGFLPTEKDVFERLQEGLSDVAIGIARQSSLGTTKYHIYNMQKKFQAAYKDNEEFVALRGELQVDIRMAAVLLNVYRSQLKKSLQTKPAEISLKLEEKAA